MFNDHNNDQELGQIPITKVAPISVSFSIFVPERGTCKENYHAVSHDGKFGQDFNAVQIVSYSVGNLSSEPS